MADIAGIGGGTGTFGFNPARSSVEETRPEDLAARRRLEEETTARPVEEGQDVAAPARTDEAAPSDTEQQATDQGQRELDEDTVTLSQGAEQALAANDTAAPRETEGAVNVTAAADTRETNQVTRQEDTTSEVNGNQNNQSETTRTLGQVVDQFA